MSLDCILHRKPTTGWERFCRSPLLYLTELIYKSYPILTLHVPLEPVRVVCLSDTHNLHEQLPPLPNGDVLIHAGDLTQSGTPQELHAVLAWLNNQPHHRKIFIAGNHDRGLEDPSFTATVKDKYPGLLYLQETSVSLDIRGRELVFYGSPFTPRQGSWTFQFPRMTPLEARLDNRWSSVPTHVDVLITHGPPRYHLDFTSGCIGLLNALWRIKPILHVFGHTHGARGLEVVDWTDDQAAYESILSRESGWWKLLVLVYGWIAKRTVTQVMLANLLRH
ncbi:Metallo-dependent phosphatase [Phlegmacium glaucopus]|nr:Metallo-dependent phosphatase [Phlegmacium glaucopus]